MPFPHYTQHVAMDCGPSSLRIVAAFYGKDYSLQNLRERCHITREGTPMVLVDNRRLPELYDIEDLKVVL